MKTILVVDAFLTGFLGSLRASHNGSQLRKLLDNMKRDGYEAWTYDGEKFHFWHLWWL